MGISMLDYYHAEERAQGISYTAWLSPSPVVLPFRHFNLLSELQALIKECMKRRKSLKQQRFSWYTISFWLWMVVNSPRSRCSYAFGLLSSSYQFLIFNFSEVNLYLNFFLMVVLFKWGILRCNNCVWSEWAGGLFLSLFWLDLISGSHNHSCALFCHPGTFWRWWESKGFSNSVSVMH